ncbi:MAG: hypothetical protein H6719_18040 [Sandaracinaceae bacterium]|nr:hypothetical protein [Sandaracinaceae bacterium]
MRALIAGSLLLIACGPAVRVDGGAPPGIDASLDAARPDAQADVEGTGEWTVLVRYARFPELPTGGSRLVPGMNLDGHVSASSADPIGCFFEDWVAPDRYVDVEGIDNQAPDIFTAVHAFNDGRDVNADILASIVGGGALHVLRISRIGDPVDDGEVDVALFRVDLVDAPVYETVVLDGRSLELLAPGQTFRVQPDSLIEGRPRTVFPNGSLRGGRLFTEAGTFSLRIPTAEGAVLVLELEGTRVSGRVGDGSLDDALLAGWVRREDVPASIGSLNLDPPVDPETLDAIAGELVDIDSDGDGTCDAISIGMEIQGVAANLVFP